VESIHIVGTYGIPNRYGGFERFAGEISTKLAKRGYAVTVYNPSSHPYRNPVLGEVRVIRKPFPRFLGPAAPLFFDLFCLRQALRSKAHVILQCGYTSSVWLPFLPRRKRALIITHMDGMEWKRGKWGWMAGQFIRWCEKLAVKYSDRLLTDHREVQKYYSGKYRINTFHVGYGVDEKEYGKGENVSWLSFAGADLKPEGYCLSIARLEPENQGEMIIRGFLQANIPATLVMVGDTGTRYGKKLMRRFGHHQNICFAGALYDTEKLRHLRQYCRVYLHGHSVGGTNPSLLEAMADGCLIMAHDNPFNREVLMHFGKYFRTSGELAALLREPAGPAGRKPQIEYTRENYRWEKTVDELENVMGTRAN